MLSFFVKGNRSLLVVDFHLQIIFNPLERIHQFFAGNGHVVACVDGRRHGGFEGCRDQVQLGQQGSRRPNEEGDVHADGAVYGAPAAHRAPSEENIDHLLNVLLIEIFGSDPAREDPTGHGVVPLVDFAQLVDFVSRNVSLIASS